MASEYVDYVIFVIRIIAIIANVMMFYLLFYYWIKKDVAVSSRRVALTRWLVSKTVLCHVILPVWWYFPLLSIFFVPPNFREELLYEILAYAPSISVPLAPLFLASTAVTYYDKKRLEEKRARRQTAEAEN